MRRNGLLFFTVLVGIAGCAELDDPSAALGERSDEIDILVPDLNVAGIEVVARPWQWSTTDGSPGDQACLAGETAFANGAGGTLCVVGTHGAPGVIQCMPPPGVFTDSGAGRLMCSICYAGAPTTLSGEGSVSQVLAQVQDVPCQDVIACTGSVAPIEDAPRPGGGTCPTMRCNGIWVNGCTPPQAINPQAEGVCFTTGQPASFGNPSMVTVGCRAGDVPSDVWQRCRDRYASHVTDSGVLFDYFDDTCADEWRIADPSRVGYQECQALVRSCTGQTQAVCLRAALGVQ